MILLNNGKYDKNEWTEPITPTKDKMDKIEDALSYAIDMNVEYRNITAQTFNLTTSKNQYLSIDKDITINLPNVNYNVDIHLFLNCEQECKIKFISSGDEQSTYLTIGLYDIELIYVGNWIIKI